MRQLCGELIIKFSKDLVTKWPLFDFQYIIFYTKIVDNFDDTCGEFIRDLLF